MHQAKFAKSSSKAARSTATTSMVMMHKPAIRRTRELQREQQHNPRQRSKRSPKAQRSSLPHPQQAMICLKSHCPQMTAATCWVPLEQNLLCRQALSQSLLHRRTPKLQLPQLPRMELLPKCGTPPVAHTSQWTLWAVQSAVTAAFVVVHNAKT